MRRDGPRRPARTFEPPAVPAAAVPRRRITSLLDLAAHQRLTIVVAPPGYGKTVLLSQWAAAHPRRRVRWLTVLPSDNDPTTFVKDLRAALDVSGPAADHAVTSGLDLDPETTPSFVAPLLADVERMPPTTLIVDDFHVLTNPALLDDLATLVDHAPRSVRVVVATRVDPPLRYYRLSLSDAVVEVRQQDLAFTEDEASELLRQLTHRELSPSQIGMLVARTEGWAVGLQLAALSLRERADVDEFVETFAGDDRHVADYLTEEVLRGQPERVRRFLLATSVLDAMSGPLCDAVTGRRGSQAMLEQLDRGAMFVTRVDGRDGWYRYHPLFHTLLRQHLHDEDPALERELLHRAGEWCLARDDLESGVAYFADAGAWHEVLEVASVHGGDMLTRGRAGTVASWIARVPPCERHGNVGVMLVEAAGSAIGGSADRADEVLDALDECGPVAPGEASVASMLHAYSALRHGDAAAAAVAATRALHDVAAVDDESIPNVLGLTRGTVDVVAAARVILGAARMHEGRFVEARDSLDAVPERCHEMWQVAALGSLAMLDAACGRLTDAEGVATRATSLAGQFGLDEEPVATAAYLALATVNRERDDLERAHALLEAAKASSRPERRGLVATLLAMEQALLALAEGHARTGSTILASRRAGEQGTLPDAVVARWRAAEAQLLISAGDLEGAAHALDLSPDESSEVVAAKVRLAVEHGDLDAARELIGRWPAEPAPRAELERGLWRAVVHHLEGDEAGARAEMTPVLAAAEHEQNIRLFQNAHALGLARVLYREAPTPFLRAIVDQPVPDAHARPAKELVEQLTEREFMVLQLLPTRLSNVDIADTLGVSLNTVKTHLKHIYRKLAVADRSEAIVAAERLHL